MKKIGIAAGVVVVLVVLWVAAGPYLTVYRMKGAAENRDGEALSSHVDFPALRKSLKDQMNSMMGVNRDVTSVKDIPLAAIGSLFGGMITDKLVDLYVTPESIVKLMSGRKPDQDRDKGGMFGFGSKDGEPAQNDPATDASGERPFSDAAMSYDGLDRFTVTLRDEDPARNITFVLRRQGLSWKLTEILLPR